jgi:hypothetical protein
MKWNERYSRRYPSKAKKKESFFGMQKNVIYSIDSTRTPSIISAVHDKTFILISLYYTIPPSRSKKCDKIVSDNSCFFVRLFLHVYRILRSRPSDAWKIYEKGAVNKIKIKNKKKRRISLVPLSRWLFFYFEFYFVPFQKNKKPISFLNSVRFGDYLCRTVRSVFQLHWFPFHLETICRYWIQRRVYCILCLPFSYYCVWNFKREPRGGTTLKERTRRNGTLRTMSNWVVYFRAIVSSVASLLITWLTFGSILYSVDYCQYCVRVTIYKTKQINDRQPEYGLVPLANFRYDFSVGLQTKIKFRITRLTIGRIKKVGILLFSNKNYSCFLHDAAAWVYIVAWIQIIARNN